MNLSLPVAFYLPALALLGLAVGSFLNVVIYRLPVMIKHRWSAECASEQSDVQETAPPSKPYNLLFPPSTCPDCGHRIRAWENIPVFSWLWLHGRCSACKTPISVQYPVVELLTMTMTLITGWWLGFDLKLLFALVLTWTLIGLAFIDKDSLLLPDVMTLPLLWIGLLVNLNGLFVPLTSAVIGAVAGYLSLWGVYHLFRLTTGKEGMGYGDFKLLAALGAWFGWQMLPLILLLSSLVGAITGVALIVIGRHHREHPLPFGPYLAATGWIALLWGPFLTNAWLGTLQGH